MTKGIPLKPCTIVYILLMLLTLFTWYAGVSEFSGLTISFIVLGLSLLKGHLIGDYYMGLKTVSGGWRWLIVGWLVLPGMLITIAFFISAG